MIDYSKFANPKPAKKKKQKAKTAKRNRDWIKWKKEHIESVKGRCQDCGQVKPLQAHHIKPKKMGGSNSEEIHSPQNMALLCEGCHKKRHGIFRDGHKKEE